MRSLTTLPKSLEVPLSWAHSTGEGNEGHPGYIVFQVDPGKQVVSLRLKYKQSH